MLGECLRNMKRLACLLGLAATMGLAAPVVVARVADGETRRALAGAMVTSEGSDIMAVTDSAGRCMVVVAPRKGGTLSASHQGYLDLRVAGAWPVKSSLDTVAIDFMLYPNRPRVVAGKVTDAGTRLALVGAKVAVGRSDLSESTRVDGSFLFDNFPAGPQSLEVSFPGYPPKSFSVEAKGGETTDVNAALVDTANVGRVEGVVSDAGTGLPVPEARVSVEGTELGSLTDSAGSYIIENVPAGMHKLLVTCPGHVNAYTVVRLVKDWAVTVNLHLRAAPQPPVPVK
jgi:hypothetical protein